MSRTDPVRADPAYTEVEHPRSLTPEGLDRYLARGWYRDGQSVFTCRLVLGRTGLCSAVWTRVPLTGWVGGRSTRKLLRRVRERYSVSVGPAVVDEEHERLYARYLTVVTGSRSASLEDFLYREALTDVFDTREVQIRDRVDGTLVAFSYFDAGAEALQSLIGVYEPGRARDSLGYATLALEAEWGRDVGFRWLYAGYVLPGDPSMDYKLRLGPPEHWDGHAWRPWSAFPGYGVVEARLGEGIRRACAALDARQIPAKQRVYPFFEAGARDPALAVCFAHPILAHCFPAAGSDAALVIVYDLDTERWQVQACVRAGGDVDLITHFDPGVEPIPCPWLVQMVMPPRARVEDAADDAVKWVARLRRRRK